MKYFLPLMFALVLGLGTGCGSSADHGNEPTEASGETLKDSPSNDDVAEPADELQTVGEEGLYELHIPDFLRSTTGLNADATLEYENQLKEFYMIVIHKPIDEFHDAIDEAGLGDLITKDLTGYHDFVTGNLSEAIELYDEGSSKEIEINGTPGRELSIEGGVGGVDIYYHFTTFKGKERYYQVLSWTLLERKDRFQDEMQAIVRSFKEI